MAIPDVSILTQEITSTLTNGTGLSAISNYSLGQVPQTVLTQIENLITRNINQQTGRIDRAIYQQVAEVLGPFAPGVNLPTLAQILETNDIFGLSTDIAGETISSIIDNALNLATQEFNNIANQVKNEIDRLLSNSGLSGVLQGVVNEIAGEVQSVLGPAIGAVIPPAVNIEISSILSGTGVDTSVSPPSPRSDVPPSQRPKKAAEVLKANVETDLSVGQLTALIDDIDITVAGTVVTSNTELPGPPPYVIGSGFTAAGGTFVSSIEELEAEMTSATRDISEVIVHWSETFTNAYLSGSDLETLTGAGPSNYHFMIRRDGSLERGVDINSVGSHTPILNHDAFSIGICFIGGINAPSASDTTEADISAASLTTAQLNTFYQFMRVFFNQYPGGQALGHRDVDISQEDPGFDVRDYVYNTFGKKSLFVDPLSEPAKSPNEINAPAENAGDVTVLEKDPDVLEKKI